MSTREFVTDNADKYIGWLSELCSLPSLASEPEGLARAADWVETRLQEVGATTKRLTIDTAPDAILATIGRGPRSVLIYDHYDVQPVDPIDLWRSDPFGPEIRDRIFFARGCADNKGDLVARIAALDAYRHLHGDLPITVKFLIEGEEEVGSRHFESLITRHGDELRADGCIWEGNGIDAKGRPAFVFGAKGLAYVELTYRGLTEDQHSALAAHTPSPVWHLVEALATLRSPDGRVLIDGFYDDVVAPTEDDLEMLRNIPFEEEAERTRLGIDAFVGNATGMDLVRRYYFEPTCNIAGIVAGFTVPGLSKTVLPKEALAKLDMRLVPNQDPHDIVEKLRKHLDARGFGDIHISGHSMEHPVRSPSDSLIGRAALEAATGVFDEEASVAPLMIATGPMYPVAHTLGIPTVSPGGVTRPESNIHAPNENIRVEDFLKIVEFTVAWMSRFADVSA
ncbi:MAG TPA: M20/M25/M40 family metallo-hydrolase [Actinomycetota bacterium]|nr:M20/M25/M40 family metallo-hydrolase [Actinomycetota bacterium]